MDMYSRSTSLSPVMERDDAYAPGSKPPTEVLDIVLKVTERCNLACPYCYFFYSGDESYQEHPSIITDNVVLELAAFIRDAVLRRGIRMVSVAFHGGEPLLLKKRKFRWICEQLQAAVGQSAQLILAMQTNGALVDDEWVSLFAKYQMRIGMSIDGVKELHDKTRIDKQGRGTYTQTLRGWEKVRDAADEGRIPLAGTLTVVDPDYSGEEIFLHLAKNLRSRNMDFLLPDLTHDAPEVTPDFVNKCGDYLLGVIRGWSQHAVQKKIRIRFFEEIIAPLLNDEICNRAKVERPKAPLCLIIVSSNGDICPHDTLRGVAPRMRDTGLNVGNHTLADVWRAPAWNELWKAQKRLPDDCRSCRWENICGAGPQYVHRFSQVNGFDNPSIYCASLKRMYSALATQVIRSGYEEQEIFQRLESKSGMDTLPT